MRAFGVEVDARRPGAVGRARRLPGRPSSRSSPTSRPPPTSWRSAAITGTTVRLPGLSLERTRPGRHRARRATSSGWAARSATGRGARAHRPRAAARRHRRHGQQLRRVHDARLRRAVRRRADDDRGDRTRPRQGVRPARRDAPRTCAGSGSRSTRAPDYLRVQPGEPQRGTAADLRRPPDRDVVLADRHARRRSSSRSPAVVGKTCPDVLRRSGGVTGAAVITGET